MKGKLKRALSALVAVGVMVTPGCAALQSTANNIESAAGAAVSPEQFELHYKRIGNTIHFLKRSCSGTYCVEP